jgi:hypothetical protein
MQKLLISFKLLCASLCGPARVAHAALLAESDPKLEGALTHALNPVVQWNKILLVIVRTPNVQPATVQRCGQSSPTGEPLFSGFLSKFSARLSSSSEG